MCRGFVATNETAHMEKVKEKKKLMLLGGLRYLLPVIRAAHERDIHVITVDYLPDNIAHRYSDEYHNVSIIDKEAVLTLARELKIDGIMSFAVDPGVVTAAYVAERMGLPFQGSYESVAILQDKGRFRKFLSDNGFNTPKAASYTDLSEAMADTDRFRWPVIVKPTDSAGSKGVTRVDTPEQLPSAVAHAIEESHSGQFIIEEFLDKVGHSSDTDCFVVEGRPVFCSFSCQIFDDQAPNPYTPSAYSWPSDMPREAQQELQDELTRLMQLLGIRTGIFNIETRYCSDGKTYIMEVTPRGGGNRLAEMLEYATGTRLVDNAVRSAVGEPTDPMEMPRYDGHLAEIILHASHDGEFVNLEITPPYDKYVIETDLWIKPGEAVRGFSGANHAVGTLVLRFPDAKTLSQAMADVSKWCRVNIK